MQNEEILNQEEHDQEMPNVEEAVKTIYAGHTQKISYSQTYQAVFRLCKKGLHQNLIEKVSLLSKEYFQVTLKTIDPQQKKDEELFKEFQEIVGKIQQAIERLMQIFLYVETNYFYQCKRNYNSIKDMLVAVFYENLCENKQILNKISKYITRLHIENQHQTIQNILILINELDEKETFLEQFIFPNYSPILSQSFKELILKKIQTCKQQQYFIEAKQMLKNERAFLNQYFKRNNGKKVIENMMKKFYDVIVVQNKEYIYNHSPEELFNDNTTQCLQLLSEKGQEQEIQEHNDWFVQKMKSIVTEYDKAQNQKFLYQFIEFYEKVSNNLTATKKFNIKYKAVFFFQQWINDEKINLPKRINMFIEESIKKGQQVLDQNKFLHTFHILFKLLKEKDLFQKGFRETLIFRNVYQNINTELQDPIIKIMLKDCGQQWTQKIQSLKESIKQNKQQQIFQPIMFEDVVWPFEKRKQVATFPKQMLSLSTNFKAEFEEQNKGKKLVWDCFLGCATLSIKFNNTIKEFKVDTCMASILLYMQSLNYKTYIKQVIRASDYTFQEIKETLTLLSKHKIISIGSLQNINEQISLNQQYNNDDKELIDLTLQYRDKSLQYQQQEELRADRKLMVQALIIKIMKNSKIIVLEDLYKKITPMIETRGFNFNQVFIDNTFKGLITKNYVRNLEDGKYSYIAS